MISTIINNCYGFVFLNLILLTSAFANQSLNLSESIFTNDYLDAVINVKIIQKTNKKDLLVLYQAKIYEEDTTEFTLVKIFNDGKVNVINIPISENVSEVRVGNISTNSYGSIILSLVVDSKIKLFTIDTDLTTFTIDNSIEFESYLAYFYEDKLYSLNKLKDGMELVISDYSLKNGVNENIAKKHFFESARSIDELYLSNGSLFLTGDFFTDKNIEKKLVIINKDKVSYINLGDTILNTASYLGNIKDNNGYVIMAEGSKRRVKSYSLAEINILKSEIVQKYSFDGVFEWVKAYIVRDKPYVFETEAKNENGKYKYSLYCRNIFSKGRKKIEIKHKFKQFYKEVYFSKTKNDTFIVMVLDEVRGRVANNVISVIKMPPITELCR